MKECLLNFSFEELQNLMQKEAEAKRQQEVLENGGKVIEETRRYDDKNNVTISMRVKETGNDYRYFPEPDLVPIEISDEWLKEIKDREPELRDAKMLRYEKEYVYRLTRQCLLINNISYFFAL